MRLILALGALTALAGAAPARAQTPGPPPAAAPAAPRDRVAIQEFTLEGEDTSVALAMQLQDGFVLGLTRAGVPVLDSVDVGRRLSAAPELERCEASLCLKRMGQLLGVRYLLRVRVAVTGNSYRATARLFSTEAAMPAVVPVDTQQRFCDVCTVAEAREMMIRLAEVVKRPLEAASAVNQAVAPAPGPDRTGRMGRAAVAGGLAAVLAGIGVLLAVDDGGRAAAAIGGGLVGAGLVLGSTGIYLMVRGGPGTEETSSAPRATIGVALAF